MFEYECLIGCTKANFICHLDPLRQGQVRVRSRLGCSGVRHQSKRWVPKQVKEGALKRNSGHSTNTLSHYLFVNDGVHKYTHEKPSQTLEKRLVGEEDILKYALL